MESGPRREPGVTRTRQSAEAIRAELEREVAPDPLIATTNTVPEERVLELTREQVTALNLILTKRQLAESQQRLAMINLRDAQAALVQAAKEEAVALARIAASNNLPRISDVRAVGPNKIACKTS